MDVKELEEYVEVNWKEGVYNHRPSENLDKDDPLSALSDEDDGFLVPSDPTMLQIRLRPAKTKKNRIRSLFNNSDKVSYYSQQVKSGPESKDFR